MRMRPLSIGLAAALAVVLNVCGCSPGGNGDGDPVPGGQGIPEGTYSGTLSCTETISVVSESDSETVLDTSSFSTQVTLAFNENGTILDQNGDALEVGDQEEVAIAGATGVATIESITPAVDQLVVIAVATATVDVPGRGQRVMPFSPVVTVYAFVEPNTVTVSSNKVFTSNFVDGEFAKVVAQCSADLAYGG